MGNVFQPVGHILTDPTSEESLPVMIKCNWLVGERIVRLRDWDFCVVFSHLRQEPADKVVFNQTLCDVCPKRR